MFYTTYRDRVTHKGWDFRANCTEFILSLFLFTCFFLCKLIKYAFLKTKFKAEVSLWSSWVSGRLYSLILCGYYYLFPWLVRGAVQNWDFFITNTNTTHKPCILIIFSSGIHCINVVWRRKITAYTCIFVGANSRDPRRIFEIWKFR